MSNQSMPKKIKLSLDIISYDIKLKKDLHMTIRGTRTGEKKCDNVEAAIEYINKRPNENFVIYDATSSIIEQIKKRVSNTIKKG